MFLCRNLYIISTILLIQVTLIGCTNTSTTCFGAPGLSCTTHRLSCTSPLVIQILNTLYGYRAGCNDVNGLTSCTNTACCNEKPGDCFIPFSSKDYQQVKGNCSGLETCKVQRLRRYDITDTVCNGRKVSAYSKIQYDCVSNDSSKTTPSNSNYSRPNTAVSTEDRRVASNCNGLNVYCIWNSRDFWYRCAYSEIQYDCVIKDSTNTSTVCYGSSGLSCTTHRLSCTSPLVIQIINTSYGYRAGCNVFRGLSQCGNTACCKEICGDCFIPFSSSDETQVARMCRGVHTCIIPGFRKVHGKGCGGTNKSAYSKIQYDCVSNVSTSSSTEASPSSTSVANCVTQDSLSAVSMSDSTPHGDADDDTGDAEDVTGSIVGGIFGAIIIIVIVIVVVVFLYKRKTQINKEMAQETVTPQYDVIDGPGTINNLKDISEYDEVDLDRTPRVQATSAHLNPNTINNRTETSGYDEIELDSKPRKQTTDNYDHVGDDKLKITSSKGPDNYNHIEAHDHSVHEDNYNHIGNNLSTNSHHLESDYNHINGVRGTFNDEDDYNHIGDNDNRNVITDDNYHHIGSGDIKVEGDYNHIGSDSDDHDNQRNYDNDDTNYGQDDSEAPYNLASC